MLCNFVLEFFKTSLDNLLYFHKISKLNLKKNKSMKKIPAEWLKEDD